jgi:outer membrane assembly lipoprotein YfiO
LTNVTCITRTLIAAAAAALAAALLVVGCGVSNPHPTGSYERAMVYQDAGRYQEAADAYGLFLRRSPTDSLAAQAQFEKAMSYKQLKEYPMAVVELQILRQEYPNSELVQEALFEECEARFLQVGRVERDITSGFEARDSYLDFLRTYPMSPWRPAVEARLVEIADMVVAKQLKAVDLYRRMKKHESAAIVLDRLIESERKSTRRDELLWERASTAQKLEDADGAVEFLERLIAEHPESSYAGSARDRLERLRSTGGA